MKITRVTPTNDRLIRTAAYCRVSTLQEIQEDSLESQTEYFKNLIEGDPNLEFAGIYADKKSGTKDDREAFQRMIDDALEGKIDRILCKSVSRFSRNVVDALHYIEVLDTHGVNVVFLMIAIRGGKFSRNARWTLEM